MFVSVILSVAFVGSLISATAGFASGSASFADLLIDTEVSNQVKAKDTSKVINGMSIALPKLLRRFNETLILTFSSSTLLFSNFSVIHV